MIKLKGKVGDEKEIGIVRLFSVNCNGFGLLLESKSNQIKKMSMVRNIDNSMISSSDVYWNAKYESNMVYRLKNVNKKVIINTFDSGEEIDNSIWFLKVRTVTKLWNSIVNYVEVDSTCKQEHG